MNARDKIAEIIHNSVFHLNGLPRVTIITKDVADAILAALPDMIPDLVWMRNGDHHAGGYGHVIRKMGSQFVLTGRNSHARQFDTIEAAKAAANAHHKAQLAKAMGWDQ